MTNIRKGRPGITWTPDMVKYLKKNYKTQTQANLATHFNCTLLALKSAITRYEVRRKRVRGWTAADDIYLLQRWESLTAQQIAEQLNKSRSAIIRRFNNIAEWDNQEKKWIKK